jgi:eukaryotic-like serine/threonine-protein kinase
VETPAGTAYQFGAFEVNADSGELLKQGKRVRLQEQPFRLLVVLLENAGRVVTREELKTLIWEGTTFVDFESSLRVAVRKLRDALGDDAENPRYVETIPKRGYRFLGPVVRPAANKHHVEEIDAAVVDRSARAASSYKWVYIVGLLAVLAIAALVFIHSFRTPGVLTEKDTVVLADFLNSTGDPLFDGTLRQGMEVQLEQSPFLSLISQYRAQQVLQLMGKPADTKITTQIAREICERTGSTAVLSGSISMLGSKYVLGMSATDCDSGKVLAEEQVQATKEEDVLDALGRAASKFRGRLGESLATIEKHNTPLAESSTSSLEALKAYSTGEKVHYSAGSAATIPFLKRAIEIDPQFVMAYGMLGRVYGDLGEADLSGEYTSRAYQLRERASDSEKFFIAVSYDLQVTGNMEKAQQNCAAWIQTYPRVAGCRAMLAGEIAPISGKYAEAVDAAKKAVELDPDFPFGYSTLAYAYEYQDRYAEAEKVLDQAATRKLDFPDFLTQRYDLAFLEGDAAKMDHAAAIAEKNRLAEGWILDHEAFAAAYTGHLKRAVALSQRAADLARQSGEIEKAALFETGAALWQALFGDAPGARQSAMAALKLSKNRDVEYGAAFALALSGDFLRSLALANDLERRFPEDTSVKFSYVPALRALQALNHRQPALAIDPLKISVGYDLGAPRSSIYGFFGALYPVYVRGEAYLAAHKGKDAVAEFQKITDHRGIVVSDPIGAVARLQLGRAYAESGDLTKAKSAYQDFLVLWKDADPGIPILTQAKAEYAKLQ